MQKLSSFNKFFTHLCLHWILLWQWLFHHFYRLQSFHWWRTRFQINHNQHTFQMNHHCSLEIHLSQNLILSLSLTWDTSSIIHVMSHINKSQQMTMIPVPELPVWQSQPPLTSTQVHDFFPPADIDPTILLLWHSMVHFAFFFLQLIVPLLE